jgi:hypothetical protein
VTSRLKPWNLRLVAWPLAVAFHGAARLVYRPLHGTRVFRLLPMRDYLYSVSNFSFRQNYSIVFDQLVSPAVSYVTEAELRDWFDRVGLVDVELSSRNGNSWRARGRRPATAGSDG